MATDGGHVRLRNALGALSERPFRLLWLGRTSSFVGDALVPVALAFAVIEVGGGASALGIVFASYTVSRVLFILAGGVWADRLPRRAVMVTCDLLRVGLQGFVAVALLTGSMELWMFVVTQFVAGAATAFFGPASSGVVPETISNARLQQANALLSFSESATQVFGPAIAGVIVATAEPGWVFALDAASYALSAVFLAGLPLTRQIEAKQRRFFADLREGAREAWSRGWMRAGFGLAAIGNLGIATFVVLGPVTAEEQLGGAAAWGVIVTGGAIGGLVGGLAAYRLRPRRPIMTSFIAWSLGALPPLALLPPAPALVIAAANGLFVFGIIVGNVLYETVLQREIPRDRLSRVSSFDWMVSLVFQPVGFALAGPVADAVGREVTLLGACALVIVCCAGGIAVPSVRNVRVPIPSPSPPSHSEREAPVPTTPDPRP